MEDTIHNFIQTASRVFMRFYGTYPERIGLDWFTRLKQFQELNYFEYYHWQEIQATPLGPLAIDQMIRFERFQVEVVPAVFGKITYYPNTPVVNLEKKPERGYDEVICEGNGISVFMTLWLTEQGHHAIVWDKVNG